jgi:outer membrane protein assembly factor BamB
MNKHLHVSRCRDAERRSIASPRRAWERVIASLLLFIFNAHVHAQNWDRFRGPNGAGQSDAKGIPTEWTEANYLWRQPLPGVGHSSPVNWGDRMFITSADPSTGEQVVLAFDVLTGKQLWEKRFGAGSYSMHGFNSFASCTPALDERHVYHMWLANDRINLAALTHDGEEVWRRDIGPFEEKHGFGKSPIVIDGLVVVANDNEGESEILALDPASGDPRWRIPRPSGDTAFATPCLLDPNSSRRQLLALSTASGLAGLNFKTGEIAWQGFENLPARCVSSPIAAGGLVFISCGQGGNGKLMIAARPGDENNPPQEVYRLLQNIPNVPTPVVAGDLLFLWHDRGVVSCHDVATGRQYWRERVGGDFHSSPIRVGKRIFAASREGEVVVLAADKNYQLLARNMLDEPMHATPAVTHDRLYVRTESTLFCIGEPEAAAGN